MVAFSAFVGRCTQSLLSPDEARAQIYTGDPIVCILATQERAKYLMALVTMAWLAIGFDMVSHTAQFGHEAGPGLFIRSVTRPPPFTSRSKKRS